MTMNLHGLLSRAVSDTTMALAELETALDRTESEAFDLSLRDHIWDEDKEKIAKFNQELENIICDLKHIVPQIMILKEGL